MGGKFDDTGRMLRFTNLPQDFAWQELKDLCKQHGRVIRTDVPRGSGTGTAVFEVEEDAQAALAKLDGHQVSGCTIRAKMDTGEGGSARGGKSGDGSGGRGGGRMPLARPRPRGKGSSSRFDDSGRLLCFRNLPQSFAWQELKDLCKMYGKVIRADVTRGSGCGTCVFEEAEEAQQVMRQLNGFTVQGCVIGVTMDGQEPAVVSAPPAAEVGGMVEVHGMGLAPGLEMGATMPMDSMGQRLPMDGMGTSMGMDGADVLTQAFGNMVINGQGAPEMFAGLGGEPYSGGGMFGGGDAYGGMPMGSDIGAVGMAAPGHYAPLNMGPPGMEAQMYGGLPQGAFGPMGGFGGFMQQQQQQRGQQQVHGIPSDQAGPVYEPMPGPPDLAP